MLKSNYILSRYAIQPLPDKKTQTPINRYKTVFNKMKKNVSRESKTSPAWLPEKSL
jgi:hypothetical protein